MITREDRKRYLENECPEYLLKDAIKFFLYEKTDIVFDEIGYIKQLNKITGIKFATNSIKTFNCTWNEFIEYMLDGEE